MRLWSLHPSYLDAKGLVALWREGLLARKVLSGQTRGYTRHSQLARFREASEPVPALDVYLQAVWEEAARRGYHFDAQKIAPSTAGIIRLPLTEGQLDYEYRHLLHKLRSRCPARYESLLSAGSVRPHPLFELEPGGVSPWEKVAAALDEGEYSNEGIPPL